MEADGPMNFLMYAEAEGKGLVREIDDQALLLSWDQTRQDIFTELSGIEAVEKKIQQNRDLSPEGQAKLMAQNAAGSRAEIQKIVQRQLQGITKEIAALEEAMSPTMSRDPAEALLRRLDANELRAQLAMRDPNELPSDYIKAIESGDEILAYALESWPSKTLRPQTITDELIAKGQQRRRELAYPEQTAKLSRLQRLQRSYQDLLQNAEHQLGTPPDDTLERMAERGR